jgi:pyruvate/2-oxoglutarate dehydrogenase complex dihydrolipoamide acyltransferase (E2) component
MNNNKNVAAARHAIVVCGAALVAGLAVPSSAFGQQPDGLEVDVAECVKLQSPGERLDCYERQVQRAQAARAAPGTAAPPPPAPPAVLQPPAPAPPPTAAPRAAAPAAAAPSAPAERNVRAEDARVANGDSADSPALTGTIVALREIVPNRWLITLNNGESWRQTFAERYPLQIGQRVELTRNNRFGGKSYRLTAAGVNGRIQVEPVR